MAMENEKKKKIAPKYMAPHKKKNTILKKLLQFRVFFFPPIL
jgi:hypothetical protein